MNGVLVDSDIIIDIITEDRQWFEWSAKTLSFYAEHHPLFINQIIYSEISMAFDRIEHLEMALSSHFFQRVTIPWEAAFLAEKMLTKHQSNRLHAPLPQSDFLIGAHAAISGYGMLSRGGRRLKEYFPKLHLIAPTGETNA